MSESLDGTDHGDLVRDADADCCGLRTGTMSSFFLPVDVATNGNPNYILNLVLYCIFVVDRSILSFKDVGKDLTKA